jgi:3-oxoacyl-[acyl-carrier protein] reductase
MSALPNGATQSAEHADAHPAGRLAGKTALVTGGSRGLGAGIALAFAREGADVAINYLHHVDRAAEVAAQVESLGRRAVLVRADCTDETEVHTMVDSVQRAFGEIRILVNNAGILSNIPFLEMPVSVWDEVIASHLRSAFLVSRCCAPLMMRLAPLPGERRTAKIINVSSVIAQKGGRGAAGIVHYAAAKAGVIGFTKALAGELAPAIAVNAISPGTHPTEILAAMPKAWTEAKDRELLLGIGTIDDVAWTAVFLASAESDYFTGQVLAPNGGDVMVG